jgi:hypothetical protein
VADGQQAALRRAGHRRIDQPRCTWPPSSRRRWHGECDKRRECSCCKHDDLCCLATADLAGRACRALAGGLPVVAPAASPAARSACRAWPAASRSSRPPSARLRSRPRGGGERHQPGCEGVMFFRGFRGPVPRFPGSGRRLPGRLVGLLRRRAARRPGRPGAGNPAALNHWRRPRSAGRARSGRSARAELRRGRARPWLPGGRGLSQMHGYRRSSHSGAGPYWQLQPQSVGVDGPGGGLP